MHNTHHRLPTNTHTQEKIFSLLLLLGLQGRTPSAYSITYFTARGAGVIVFKKTNPWCLHTPGIQVQNLSRLRAERASHYTTHPVLIYKFKKLLHQSPGEHLVWYGMGVVAWNESEIKKLEVGQNKVTRMVLNASRYAAVEALRGNIG